MSPKKVQILGMNRTKELSPITLARVCVNTRNLEYVYSLLVGRENPFTLFCVKENRLGKPGGYGNCDI